MITIEFQVRDVKGKKLQGIRVAAWVITDPRHVSILPELTPIINDLTDEHGQASVDVGRMPRHMLFVRARNEHYVFFECDIEKMPYLTESMFYPIVLIESPPFREELRTRTTFDKILDLIFGEWH